jgi:hypothetical protein
MRTPVGVVADAAEVGAGAGPGTGVGSSRNPHEPQNFAPSTLAAPQPGQNMEREAYRGCGGDATRRGPRVDRRWDRDPPC